MKAFTTLTSQVIPLDRKDVDTDMIIPADYLKGTGKGGYGEHLFQRLRDNEADFPLNDEKYKNAQILMAQENFGCGSSREHAVWALLEYGIQVVIAPSFADIFHSNSGKNGLLLVPLPKEAIQELIQQAQEQQLKLTVDLQQQVVTEEEGKEHAFFYDPFRKECLLKGNDDLDYLLENEPVIDEWQKEREKKLFYRTDQHKKTN